jgi:hypothetical protein
MKAADMELGLQKRRRGPKIPRLTSVARIGHEIGRIYRQMRYEQISTADGKRCAEVLTMMKLCLEASEIERRIEAIEEAIARRADEDSNIVHMRPKVSA